MSRAQFEKFYWPTWKQVMLALYEEGITSYLFIEGSYNQRLDYLAQCPKNRWSATSTRATCAA